jgi:hypothetical protein
MSTSKNTRSCDHKGKMLKLGLRSPLKAIKGVTKMINHTLRNIIPKHWSHVNVFTQFTIKKGIPYIKLRDGPLSNKKS